MSAALLFVRAPRPVLLPLFVMPPTLRFFDVTPDGSRFLFARRPLSDQDTMTISGPRIVVVVNWLATLRQRFRGGG